MEPRESVAEYIIEAGSSQEEYYNDYSHGGSNEEESKDNRPTTDWQVDDFDD